MAYIVGEIQYTGGKPDGKKALLLCVLQVLSDYSDENHPMTIAAIKKKLKTDYDMEANRNTISRNISLLRDLNFDISTYDENHGGAYLCTRVFDDMELQWLIDDVLNSKYLTEKDAGDLIKKLKKLSNKHFKSHPGHINALREWPHQKNKTFSFNMDRLEEALENTWRVRFIYNCMDCDGELHPLGEEAYEVLPLQMFCTNSQYYLIAYHYRRKAPWHFRLDRMTNFDLLEQDIEGDKAIKKEHSFNPVLYARQHPHMYAGTPEHVVFRMPRRLAGAVYDSFGEAADMRAVDEEYMQVRVHVATEGMRYFALQYGPNCEVLEPLSLRAQIQEDIQKMAEMYAK